nr:FCD domain-containing protein [uncultured Alistipes sp.]
MMKERPDSVIRKRSLAEELAERLRQRITDEQFEVGEKLPAEPELMRIFGVGRSTVREAVKILVNMGFLKVQQGAGTFVESRAAADDPMAQRLRRADIRDLDEVRRILEVAIVERAAGRRTEQDIEKIERFLAERGATAAAGRLEACIEADIRFHVALAEATHNEILYELYRSATIHLQKGFEHIYVDTGYFLASQPTHERLVRDIIARDARKAQHTIGIILKEP